MPALVCIQSLWYPVYAMRVRLPYIKLAILSTSHSGILFSHSIAISLSWGTLSNAPARSRLSIDATQPGRALHTVSTHEVISPIADRVDQSFRAPIWFQERSSCDSTSRLRQFASTFSTTFANVFSSAIGRQLLGSEQSFLPSLRSTMVVDSFRLSSNVLLARCTLIPCASPSTILGARAFRTSFGILLGLGVLSFGRAKSTAVTSLDVTCHPLSYVVFASASRATSLRHSYGG